MICVESLPLFFSLGKVGYMENSAMLKILFLEMSQLGG